MLFILKPLNIERHGPQTPIRGQESGFVGPRPVVSVVDSMELIWALAQKSLNNILGLWLGLGLVGLKLVIENGLYHTWIELRLPCTIIASII